MKKLSLLAYRWLSWLLNLLPDRFFYGLSNFLAWLLSNIFRYRLKVIRKNLELCFPDLSAPDKKRIEKQFYRNFADISLESLVGPHLSQQQLKEKFVFINPEDIDAHPNALIIGGHQGNWEWGVLAVSLWLNQPVTGVYKPLHNQPLDQYLKKKREKWGLNTIPLKQTLRWLKGHRNQPGHLVLISDQSPSNAKTAKWISFLGQSTAFNVGPERIGQMTQWPIFFFEVKRVGRGHYEVRFVPLAAGESITESYAQALEKTIVEYPADWLWSHKRWKKTVNY